ncbi:MAG: rod shape-determining protein MreC [bacterium]|nr:rod shape-determining protein MreC [bacterium]
MRSIRAFAFGVTALTALALLIVFRAPILTTLRLLLTDATDRTITTLTLENETLRAALARAVSETPSGNTSWRAGYVPVALYSRYPFNDRDRLTIARGSVGGLAIGTPIFAAADVLLGAVREVRRTQAVAQTIFDPGWRSSVSVGTHRVKAVLVGGNPPRLELIPQTDVLEVGDIVMSIDPGFPLGAVIGTIATVEPAMQNAWQTALVAVGYHIDSLEQVLLPTEFP